MDRLASVREDLFLVNLPAHQPGTLGVADTLLSDQGKHAQVRQIHHSSDTMRACMLTKPSRSCPHGPHDG